MPRIGSVVVLFAVASIACTGDDEKVPERAHPLFCTVKEVTGTTIVVYYSRPTTPEERKLHKTDLISATLHFEWEKVDLYDVKGNNLNKDEDYRKKHLQPGALVLVSQDGKAVDATAYLQVLKSNSPVLVPKEKLTFVYPQGREKDN
jgi:hypothetical protein